MSSFYKEINENIQDNTSELSTDDKTKELLSELRVDNIEELTENDLKETLEFISQNNLDTKEKIVDFLYDNMSNQDEPSVDGEIHKSGVGRKILIGMLGVISFTGGMGQGIKDSVDRRHQLEALMPQYVQEQTISADDNRYNIKGLNESILTVAQSNESGLIDWNEVQLSDILGAINSGIEALEPFATKGNEYENLTDSPVAVVASGDGPDGDDPFLTMLEGLDQTLTQEEPIAEESVETETQEEPIVEESVETETYEEPIVEESVETETQEEPIAEESVETETQEEPIVEESVETETQEEPIVEESVETETQEEPIAEESVETETQEEPITEESVEAETYEEPIVEESVEAETYEEPSVEETVETETYEEPSVEETVETETYEEPIVEEIVEEGSSDISEE